METSQERHKESFFPLCHNGHAVTLLFCHSEASEVSEALELTGS